MGSRGPIPKSTGLRVLEGERAHRPLPASGPQFPVGAMERPKGMTAAARKVWDAYIDQMPLGILRPVDALALRRLCEDVALLQELQAGMRKLANERKKEARLVSEQITAAELRLHTLREFAGSPAQLADVQGFIDGLRTQIHQGPAMVNLTMSPEGRRLSASINALAQRIGRQELQFGLTPVSAQRLEGAGSGPMLPAQPMDSIEARLCG